MAVALLAQNIDSLCSIKQNLQKASPDSVIEAFSTNTEPSNLKRAFQEIRNHASFQDLKLKVAIFSIKHWSKKPFMTENYLDLTHSLETYVGGAFAFAQEVLKLFFKHHGALPLSETDGQKKGTLIFTGTPGALRCNAEYGAYGAGRAGVRQLAQSSAREMSVRGIHVVHTIANGSIADEDGEDQRLGKKMSADAVGKTYLWLSQKEPELWTHELDMRPAQEKF